MVLSKFLSSLCLLAAPLLAVAVTVPKKPSYDAFHANPNVKKFESSVTAATLTYVQNSGICETTPGVQQVSGYITVGSNMNMWFWFFAARNNPSTAPFTLWLNGGPGCSSMIGLFQEHGPCTVNSDGATTTNNPYSWNTVSNMIYIDQPIGTGFSYGTDSVTSTITAAPFVWQAFQVLFESTLFSQYASRTFNFATESYGGHYGPEFYSYFLQQNALIASGSLPGAVKMDLGALLINNGWIDPLIQNLGYITFAANAPGYGPLVSSSTIKSMNTTYYESGGCLAQQQACYAVGNSTTSSSDKTCQNADNFCASIGNDAIGNLDPYDLRQSSAAAFPPEYYVNYLGLASVTSAIGAVSTYSECPNAPYNKFVTTGDDARTFLPQLAALANTGMRILIWAGDADIICNWVGVQAAITAMQWSGQAQYASTPMTNMTINGVAVASVQNVGNFSFARVYGAGHEVPAFQPAAALEIFTQVINGQPLTSV
jgi:carboxypeptidase C (cathepsin A)